MSLEPITLMQIIASSSHLYGLDQDGVVWFRTLTPSNSYSTPYNKKEDEEKDAKTVWKRMSMMGRISNDAPPEKEMPLSPAELEPAREPAPESTLQSDNISPIVADMLEQPPSLGGGDEDVYEQSMLG